MPGQKKPNKDAADSSLPSYESAIQTQAGSSNVPDVEDDTELASISDGQAVPISEDGRINLQFDSDLDEFLTTINTNPDDVRPSMNPSNDHSIRPPKMNVLMLAVGSRGDIQPFVAFGLALKGYGHRVRLATHTVFRTMVQDHGIDFFDLGGDPAELMAYMVKNPGLVPSFDALCKGEVQARRYTMKDIIHSCWRAAFEPSSDVQKPQSRRKLFRKTAELSQDNGGLSPFVADAIIANPPSLGHIHCAERLGIPLHIFFTMPWSPATQVPHPLANVRSSDKEKNQANFWSYYLVDSIIWQGLGSIVNRFRDKTLELDPIHPSKAPMMLHTMGIPHTYCWSPSLLPRPIEWRDNISVVGYTFLEKPSSYCPPPALLQFLEAGTAPIYVGFGSIVVDDPLALMLTLLKAIESSSNRVILATGWSSADQGLDRISSDPSRVFILREDCPHDWLFPKVSCVIHHGGAGTTAAGLRAGRPTVIVPFFGDQFFWGDAVHRAGAGPKPIPYRELEASSVIHAIQVALHQDTLNCAEAIGENIRNEDGAQGALQQFHRSLPQSGMACSLVPEISACWISKSTGMILSSLAATILQKNLLIEWNDLELHRSTEYEIAHGPYEPISGAAWAVTELILDGLRGAGEMVAELGHTPWLGVKFVKDKWTQKTRPRHNVNHLMYSPVAVTKHIGVLEQEKQVKSASSPNRRVPGSYMATGMLRTTTAMMRAPGEFAAALAQGSHNMPLLWGDTTVRPTTKIVGFKSGVVAGCEEFALGLYDGISGLFIQPCTGAMKEGPIGFLKGVGRGTVGIPLKFFAAGSGIVGYPLRGIDISARRALRNDGLRAVQNQRMLEGECAYRDTTEEFRREVVRSWQDKAGPSQRLR